MEYIELIATILLLRIAAWYAILTNKISIK